MPLYWLCYQHNNQISVVIEPGASPIHARMPAALAELDEGEFTEGHELDCQVPRPAPSTWPLAVRLLVITSSMAENFETNAR